MPVAKPGRFAAFLSFFSYRSLKSAVSTVFNLDYELTQSLMPVCGIIGSILYVVFHYTEKSMGFSDSGFLRSLSVALAVSILFWPRDGRLKRMRIAHWELSIAFLLPIFQTYLFLINPTNPYWSSSNLFWAFFSASPPKDYGFRSI